jgi:hypothetical protein
MKQEGYCKQVVIDQFLQDTYPQIKKIKNLNLSVFLTIVARAVQDKIDQAMLPRTMKSGKNCTWIKAPNFASAMTHDKRDVLYTKEGILATFEDVEMPHLELTLKKASSATSEVTKPSQELVTVELKGDKNTMKESTLSCSERSPTVDTFSEDKRNMFSYPEPVETFEDTCKGINDKLFHNVMSHEEGKLFNKIDEVRVKRAILVAAKKTRELLDIKLEEHKETIQDQIEECKDDSDSEKLFEDQFEAHFSEYVRDSDIVQWLKHFAIKGVWDLGCKNSTYNCFCPFDKRFQPFLDKVMISDELKDHAAGSCKCNNRKRGYKYSELTQHMKGQNDWLHRMVGFYMHNLYDDYDEQNLKYISLESVDRGRKRKHDMTNFEVMK